jgi:CRISPR-associated protein Cas1
MFMGTESPQDSVERSPEERELLPVRMLNEFVYCPRLFYLIHVDGRWAENAHTVSGRQAHRRVDNLEDALPNPQEAKASDGSQEYGDPPPVVSRSVSLSSPRLGLTAKLDLVSTADDEALPVERKVGRVPQNEQRSWEPERVQLMAQGMLLREHGYRCDHGVLYFVGSRTRVDIPFTPELEASVLRFLEDARRAAATTSIPLPLEDSPKCPGCSLAGICLPDETLALKRVPVDPATPKTRRLYPAHDDARPLYVQEQGATVGKNKSILVVRKQGQELGRARLADVSQLVLCGSVTVTAQTVHLLCEAGVPIVHLSMGHWFYGITHGIHLRNAFDRAAQFAVACDTEQCLEFAKATVRAKGTNQRTLIRRNVLPAPRQTLRSMAQLLKQAEEAADLGELRGYEGNVAAHYFRSFSAMLKPRSFDTNWDFENRNKRPPKDPVNALLSFGYALLSKEVTAAIVAEGLDPWWGLYHQPRHGRPSLALDLMEELRPLVVDSAVITAINTGMVGAKDFTRTEASCVMKTAARKALIRSYEARLDHVVTHPVFGYRCTWRALIRVQTRLFARWLRKDIPAYIGMTTR